MQERAEMIKEVKKLEKSRMKIVITVPAKEMVKYFKQAYSELAPTVKLQGFRPGKAPQKLIESSLGVGKIVSEAMNIALNKEYYAVIKEKNIVPISQPNIVIDKYPTYGLTESEVKDDLEFTAEFEIYPEISVGDYSKIKVDMGKPEEPNKEDVDKILIHLQKQKASFTDIERAAKSGDFAEIDFEGFLKKVRIDSMCSKHHPVVLGEGSLIPGFEDQVVGMKKDEEKTFKIKFPKDYQAKDLAGKEAEFKVKVNALREIQMPELDDKFAEAFGQKTLKDLSAAIKKSVGEEMIHKFEHDLEERVLEKVLPMVKVEVPERLVDQEVQRTIERYQKQLTGQGLDFDGYLKSIKKELADMEKELRPQAEKNVKIGLFLGKLIQDQKLDENDPDAGKKALSALVKKLTK